MTKVTDPTQSSPCAVIDLRSKSVVPQLPPASAEADSDGIDYFEIIDQITWGKPDVAETK